MKPSFRAILSILFMLAFAYGMMFFGDWINRTYTDGGSALFLATVFGLFASTVIWSIWNLQIGLRDETRKRQKELQKNSDTVEKRKRERIDTVLRDLSSEDLIRLRERLSDGSVDDELLYNHMVGGDDELVNMGDRNY
jgi:hypothetical protein